MADVAKKGVSTAENSNGFINNVASDTNTAPTGGLGGEGEEEPAGNTSPAAPDLLSFRLPASDDGASLQELIESELALRIKSASVEEYSDEEEGAAEEESRLEETSSKERVEEGVVEPERKDEGEAVKSPPVDLLLDFSEPTSPLGGGVAVDMFGRQAQFPEDVLTPEEEVVSPDIASPELASPEEAVVPSGRAPWATPGVEDDAGVAGDRRVPFIGPAEVSLVDFSTTVTDDSAFEMLTPPTEDKVFGVNIPEIRVDTPPVSSPEDQEEVMGEGTGSLEEEPSLEDNQEVTGVPEPEIQEKIVAKREIFTRVDDDDGWECVESVSVQGMEEEEGQPEGLREGEGSKGGEVDSEDNVNSERDLGEEEVEQVEEEYEVEEGEEEEQEVGEVEEQEVEEEEEQESEELEKEEGEEMGEESVAEEVSEAGSDAVVEEPVVDEGSMEEEEKDVGEYEDASEEQVILGGRESEAGKFEQFSVSAEILTTEEERNSVSEEVEREEAAETMEMSREDECAMGDDEEGSDVMNGGFAPVESSPPIGKIVIPSTFGGPPDETDRGPCVQHADVEFDVPACRPSLVDWNAVVKKEEQKSAIGTAVDPVQDAEPPKKAGTRKVKKDSGGEGKKKAKKGKKSDAEKENFSVNLQSDMGSQMGVGFPKVENDTKELEEEGLSGISLQALKETYCSQASKPFQADEKFKEVISASISINDLKKGFEEDEPSSEEGSEVDEDEEEVEDDEEEHVRDGRLLPNLSGNEVEEMVDTSGDAGEDIADGQVDSGSEQNSVGSGRYYRSYSRLETRSLGSIVVERASYCNLVNLEDRSSAFQKVEEPEQRSSFNKFDQLSKKTVLHVKSVDSAKVQKQFNEAAAMSTGQGPTMCRSCGKQVFQMEQIKAERAVWHRNCFRCKECSKQLTVDIYSSHEGQLYCKPHFRELFKPKAVVEAEEVKPMRPRKPEMIIRENQPVELPPDVVRASDKPDLGLEELSSLDVKSRFKVFEKEGNEEPNISLEKSSSGVNVKRSPSILSKLAKFQKKGMDIGVTDDSLNGVPFEQSDSSEASEASSSEDEGNEDGGVVKASRHKKKERPVSFGKMDDMKNKWESVGANGVRKTREELREERKEEIQRLRSRLFQGKQGKMKEMYEQAVMESEKGAGGASNGVKRQPSERARSLKERFEKGEAATDLTEDTNEDIRKEREELAKRAKEEELSVFEAGISKKSRSLFLELDKAQKQQNVTSLLPTPKSPLPKEEGRRSREVTTRQISDDVVRCSDPVEDVQVETADICNRFKFFETYQDAPRAKKPFRITPPREGQVKTGSPEREIYRDPNVVRCEDQAEDDSEVVVKSHTTTKMLSLFRQMEENANKEDVPEGPKPLKRFTPPPDYTRESDSEEEEESEEEDEEEEEEEEDEEQQDSNIIRASDKIEDEFLKQAMSQNAARAKSLRAKFEKWEAEMERKGEKTNGTLGPDDEAPSVDTTRNLRARFESMQSETKTNATPERRSRVNRFVEIQASCAELCSSCGNRVYSLEKVEAGGKLLHKSCFRCLQCNCILRMETYTMNNGNLYCMTHFKQLFIAKGNYDEGFGSGQHKTKWSSLKKKEKKEGSPNENGAIGKDNFFDEDSFYTKDID